MGSTLERREARLADAQQIAGWFSTRAEATSWGGPKVPDPLTAAWLGGEFETGNYWVWVDQWGKTEGVFGLVFPEDGLAHLTRFAIAPQLRGLGLSRELVEEIKDLARSLGAKQLSLGVYGSNRVARHVYDMAGFHVVGEREATEDPTGVSYKMRLDLQPEGPR